MTDLELLILTAENFCKNLDESARREREFCENLSKIIEECSYEFFKATENLKEIRSLV